MQIDIGSSTLTLTPNSLLAVQDGAGTRVLCRAGTLWITQEGDLKDAIVGAGESLIIRKPGRTLIGALGTASLSILAPAAPHPRVQRQPRAGARLTESVACS